MNCLSLLPNTRLRLQEGGGRAIHAGKFLQRGPVSFGGPYGFVVTGIGNDRPPTEVKFYPSPPDPPPGLCFFNSWNGNGERI